MSIEILCHSTWKETEKINVVVRTRNSEVVWRSKLNYDSYSRWINKVTFYRLHILVVHLHKTICACCYYISRSLILGLLRQYNAFNFLFMGIWNAFLLESSHQFKYRWQILVYVSFFLLLYCLILINKTFGCQHFQLVCCCVRETCRVLSEKYLFRSLAEFSYLYFGCLL